MGRRGHVGAPRRRPLDPERPAVADSRRQPRDGGYQLFAVVPRLVHFIDDLTNWYIRLGRPRFWKSQDRRDQAAAYHTLHEVLTTFARVLAPFMPFLTEAIHQRLVVTVDPAAPRSVHFCDYPSADERRSIPRLEASVAVARSIVALGRRLREEHRIKVRQPLAKLTVVHRDATLRARPFTGSGHPGRAEYQGARARGRRTEFVSVTTKPNFASLKKKPGAGQQMGVLKPFLENLAGSDEGVEAHGQSSNVGNRSNASASRSRRRTSSFPHLDGRCSNSEQW